MLLFVSCSLSLKLCLHVLKMLLNPVVGKGLAEHSVQRIVFSILLLTSHWKNEIIVETGSDVLHLLMVIRMLEVIGGILFLLASTLNSFDVFPLNKRALRFNASSAMMT